MNFEKPLDTTPDCAAPQPELIKAAKGRLPALLSGLPNDTDNNNPVPSPPHRLVVAEKVVKAYGQNSQPSRKRAENRVQNARQRKSRLRGSG